MFKFRKKHFVFTLVAIPATYAVYLDNPQITIPGAIIAGILGAALGYFILLPLLDRISKTLNRLTGVEKLRKRLEKDHAP